MLNFIGSIIIFLIAVWIVIAIGYIALPVNGVLILSYILGGSTGDNKNSANSAPDQNVTSTEK